MHCKTVHLECGRYCRRYDGTLYYDYHDVTNGVRQSPYTGDDGVYSTTAFTNRAVELINDHDRSTSMFMYLSYQAPHTPIQVNCCQICCSLSQKNCPLSKILAYTCAKYLIGLSYNLTECPLTFCEMLCCMFL